MDKMNLLVMSKMKSVGVGYLFYFVLGMHYAYVGNWGTQVLIWAIPLICAAVFLVSPVASILILVGLAIWMLVDIFRIPGMVRRYNERLIQRYERMEKKRGSLENADV